MIRPAGAGGGGGGGGTVPVDIANPMGARAVGGPVTVNTEIVTASPTFGSAPYSYSWAQTGVVDPAFTPTAPTSQGSAFRRTGVDAGETFNADFVCTVTDALGATAQTDTVAATVTNLGDLGGVLP